MTTQTPTPNDLRNTAETLRGLNYLTMAEEIHSAARRLEDAERAVDNLPAAITQAERALQFATTPRQTKRVEAMSAAAMAWAKEQDYYDLFVRASKVYILSRRKTTELVRPSIQHGGNFQGDGVVTLSDFGFTRKQWSRRCAELEIPDEKINKYFDECIAWRWEPTPFGLARFVDAPSEGGYGKTELEIIEDLLDKLSALPIRFKWTENKAGLLFYEIKKLKDISGIIEKDIDE